MKSATKNILQVLSDRGYRITVARKSVIDTLAHNHTPQTIQELVEKVDVDEVSVYRIIELLVAEGFVEEIALQQEKSRFALAHEHHHHVVCNNCGVIKHIPCEGAFFHAKKVNDFATIESHEVTLYGICKTCA